MPPVGSAAARGVSPNVRNNPISSPTRWRPELRTTWGSRAWPRGCECPRYGRRRDTVPRGGPPGSAGGRSGRRARTDPLRAAQAGKPARHPIGHLYQALPDGLHVSFGGCGGRTIPSAFESVHPLGAAGCSRTITRSPSGWGCIAFRWRTERSGTFPDGTVRFSLGYFNTCWKKSKSRLGR